MIAELYANMCGTELWNRARVSAYVENGITPGFRLACDPCEVLVDVLPCLDDEPPLGGEGLAPGYQLPELDPAPWYDDSRPESRNFAGFLALETVLSQPIDRRLVQNIGHGATLTRTRFEGRTLNVRGLLVGKTCCGAAYGLKWLTQALLGSFCGNCEGCTLSFFTCAPSALSDAECVMVWDEDGQHVPYVRTPDDELARASDFVRQALDVGVLQGPQIIGRHQGGGSCGGCGCASVTEVEFTLGIGNPWLYQLEDLVVADAELPTCETATCRITFNDSDNCDPFNLCAQATPCDEDPDCISPPTPPPSGLLPLQECGCLPLLSARGCVSVPAGGDWFDQALIVEVYAGSEPLRNLAIRAWQNPLGLGCCDEENQTYFDECNACATLLIGYVPAAGYLRFDSVKREVTVQCGGTVRPAARNVATVDGMPFQWLEVGCQEICLGFDVDCGNTASDATITVWRAGREL